MHPIYRIEVAGAVAAALLLGFQSVVRQSVRQGDSRREWVSRQAQAAAECSRIPRRAEREACRALLPPDGPASAHPDSGPPRSPAPADGPAGTATGALS